MEFRKIISFGKTSYVISVPKSWVTKSKLKQGDVVSIEEKEGNLIIYAQKEKVPKIEQKEIVIDTTGKELSRIRREIASAYINNFNTIIITGKGFLDKALEIRNDAIGDLIALEVMEQNSDRIIAKDFLNMEKISVKGSIKKMDMIVRSMMSDLKTIKTEQEYKGIYYRDADVNRLGILINRAINYAMENPEMLKSYELKNEELVHYWIVAAQLEKIADDAKRIARRIFELEVDSKIREKIMSIYNLIEKRYSDTMKAFYNRDASTAYDIANSKTALLNELEEFSRQNNMNWTVCDIVDKMQQIVSDIHDITRTTYLFLSKPDSR